MTERRKKRALAAGRSSAARVASATRRTDARPAKKGPKGVPAVKGKASAVKAPVKAPAKGKASAAKAPARKPAARKSATAKGVAKLSVEQVRARKELEKRVKAVSREIDKAERDARKALKSVEKRYKGILGQLKSDRTKLQARLKTLAAQGESAFDEIRIGAEGAYKELSEAVMKAYGHFK